MSFHNGKTRKTGKRLAALAIAIVMAMGTLVGLSAIFAPNSAAALSPYDYPGGEKGKFYNDYASYAEQQAAAKELNIKMAEESFVLFKNKNSALPLEPNARNISLFSSVSYPAPSPATRISTTLDSPRHAELEALDGRTYSNSFIDTTIANVQHGIIFGGTGSGAGAGSLYPLTTALTDQGFTLNPTLKDIYEKTVRVEQFVRKVSNYSNHRVETPIELLTNETNPVGAYTDAFVATVARIAGEGANLPQGGVKNLSTANINNIPYQRGRIVTNDDINKHYLQLDDSELNLLQYMKEQKAANAKAGIYTPIIYLINSATPFEMTVLEDDPDVDAIIWIGFPGVNGLAALPKILTGEVNPSGKTNHTYAADFFADPVSVSFWADKLSTAPDAERTVRSNNHYHEDDIYYGYKWYETAYADGVLDQTPVYDPVKGAIYPEGKDGDVYYNRSTGLVYPFGYGLSYTDFSQTILTTAADLEAQIDDARGIDTFVNMQVKVKNTGYVAGKDVVQLYVKAPYTSGGIEKAEVQLAAFGKSKLLSPGASEIITLKVRLGDIAAFDYNDANQNNWKGWEIEAGTYDFRVQANSHDVMDSLTVALAAHTTDLYDGVNLLHDNKTPLSGYNTTKYGAFTWDNILDKYDSGTKAATGMGGMELLTREDMVASYPGVPYAGEVNGRGRAQDCYYTPEYSSFTSSSYSTNFDRNKITRVYSEYDDRPTDLWYKATADIPSSWTQRATAYDAFQAPIQLKDMAGLDYNDTSYTLTLGVDTDVAELDGKTPAAAWDLFLNQLTFDEMRDFLFNAGFRTLQIESIGKLLSLENDGPACLNYDGRRVTYTNQPGVYNATTNPNGTRYGGGSATGLIGTFWICEINIACTWNVDLVRRQGVLIGCEALFANCSGWYAPGVQINRSPFIGRAFEYYSQDGVQGGYIAAAAVGGAQSKGVNVYLKHWGFLSHGSPGSEIVTEQSLRETHLKSYELAVKFGNATGMMATSNFSNWSGTSNYALNQELAYGEWGFKGVMITDWYGVYAGRAGYNQRTGVTYPLNAYNSAEEAADNRISGYWDATGRSGKGILMCNEKYLGSGTLFTKVDPGDEIEAPNTWYYVRESVRNALWMSANTMANYNGLDKSAAPNTVSGTNQAAIDAADKVVDIKRGLNYVSADLPTNAATTNQHTYFGLSDAENAAVGVTSKTYYEVASGTLPAGLTLDYKTGRIVGTTTADAGVTNITVRAYFDGWFRVHYTVLVRVADFLTPSAALTATAGTAFSSTLTQAWAVGDSYNGLGNITSFGNFTVQSGSVPGLSLSTAGVLSGTPTTAGTYTITVRRPVVYPAGGSSRTANIDTTYTVIVAAAAIVQRTVTFNANYTGGTNGTITVDSGSKVIAPAQPVRTGYVFTGWYTDAACTTAANFNDAVTADKTLYAGWYNTAGIQDKLNSTQNELDSAKGELSSTKSELGTTKDDLAKAQSLATVCLIIAIVAAVAAIAGIGLTFFFKKKKA